MYSTENWDSLTFFTQFHFSIEVLDFFNYICVSGIDDLSVNFVESKPLLDPYKLILVLTYF